MSGGPVQAPSMSYSFVALMALTLAAACQKSTGRAEWGSSAFGRDMDRICNALTQSGASSEPEGSRMVIVAQWLGTNLESQEGRDFLARIQPLGPADKAAALEGEATRVALPGCPLARLWRDAATAR